MVFENEEGHEVEHGCPDHGLAGGKHFGGYHGGNGVGRIVKSIDEIKDQGQGNDGYQQRHVLDLAG
jgi:hypothetical protein